MNIFNRRQLISTYNLKQVNQIKEMLNAKGIKFYISTHNRKGDDLFLSVGRGHQGTAFEKMEYECTYKIYVHKDDYEAANSLVRGELWQLGENCMSKNKEQEQVNKYMLKGMCIGLVIAIIYDICRGCLFEHTIVGILLGNFAGCLVAYNKDGNSIKGGWFLWIYFAFVLFVMINEFGFIRNEQISANIILIFAVIAGVITIVICVRLLLSERKRKEFKQDGQE